MCIRPLMITDIREAVLSDFDGVIKLLSQLWPNKELNRSALMNIFSASIVSQDNVYLCAKTDGEITGFCSLVVRNSLWQEGIIGHINELIIDESFRQMGIGAKLLEAASAVAMKKGCKRIELDSAFHREDAHRFYESVGFTRRAYLFSKEL